MPAVSVIASARNLGLAEARGEWIAFHARILERLRAEDPETVRAIGDRRLRARLARLYYKIGRQRLRRGERKPGRAALGRALALRPLYLRFLALRLRAGL